ncbi:MAG TPA: lysylphosphatidylglycerol synthase transmembrane domain-containing protein [Streptosporangiaceae bacterium]|nr:lysylphosphatidylglycerol synthase transmembrane domain-containing protein [Streptosporangiaceae bacterium]
MTSKQQTQVLVEDLLERRIRKPVDLLRCLVACTEIVALALAAVALQATMKGIETDIVGFSTRLPHAVHVVAKQVALFVLLILPVALAVRQLIRKQPERLFEALATGALAAIIVAIANALLSKAFATKLYSAIIMANPGGTHRSALDPYLAALVAYATIIGLSGYPAWRNALWLAVGIYVIVHLGTADTTIVSLLITLLAGRAVGFAVRYFAGSMSQRPSAEEIAAALSTNDRIVTEIRRSWPSGTGGSRHYRVATKEHGALDIAVYDRDQQAAGAIYRLYRAVLLRRQVSRGAALSVDNAVERRTLMSYAAEEAGAPTPRLRSVVRASPEATVLAFDHHDGITLGARDPGCTDTELHEIWDAVEKLHAHRVTHRSLTADRILLTDDGRVMLLDPAEGDVAASDLQLRLDTAQLLAELAIIVGTRRAADLAIAKADPGELVALVPLLRPVALARSTRATLRRRRDVLPELRKRMLAAVPGEEVTPVRLERMSWRGLLTIVAAVAAVYLLAGELAGRSLGGLLRAADWRWGFVALLLEGLTFGGATLSLQGFVADHLPFVRTGLAQLAGSFIRLVTPAAVGGAALNIRYLQRRKIPAAAAAASVGVWQAVAFVLHILLLLVFVAITGTTHARTFRPPTWSWFVLAGLAVVGAVVLLIPASRRIIQARAAPMLGQVLPRLLEVAQQPGKLARGVGGALLLSVTYIMCLACCVAAFGRTVPIASIALVYLTGSAFGSIMPTPGGLGAVELALTAGLTAAGVPSAAAGSAVLLFRLLTFWLPVPVGWVAFTYLERKQAL